MRLYEIYLLNLQRKFVKGYIEYNKEKGKNSLRICFPADVTDKANLLFFLNTLLTSKEADDFMYNEERAYFLRNKIVSYFVDPLEVPGSYCHTMKYKNGEEIKTNVSLFEKIEINKKGQIDILLDPIVLYEVYKDSICTLDKTNTVCCIKLQETEEAFNNMKKQYEKAYC
ncbi:MAG: hypothetical protein RSA08_03290 [Clostridia bacterium]